MRFVPPTASALAIIMLDDHASQVLMLMEGIANWLNMFETSQAELKPVVSLFERFSQVIRTVG